MAKILAVDDNTEILDVIKEALELDGHLVYTAQSSQQARTKLLQMPDILLLDIMMPGQDGISFCREMRNALDIPILFITARTAPTDLVEGLAVGADEYIKKPFSISELRARVNAHLRRETRGKHNRFVLDEFVFNLSDFSISCNKKPIALTKMEYELAEYLALHHGQVFSKQQLYDTIWGTEYSGSDHTVVEHIRKLREKLQAVAGDDPIQTIWGVGYSWKKRQKV